jgi:aspartate-semialdehyde dehydrogenase
MQTRIEVGILGATGMVGQSFIRFLQGHPWFDLRWLGASDRNAGKKYRDAMNWNLAGSVPDSVADITVDESKPGTAPQLLFSAMDASVATEIERAFAEAGHVVVSNSRNHRMEPDVPLLVPEINPDHLKLVPGQQRARGWKGQIVTNPNCSTIVLTMGLAPLKQFGITKIVATTMQAISGAGYPGVPSMDIVGNVIPFIGGEEEKMQQETQKILGEFRGDRIEPLPARMSAHCNRVPVVDGHTVTVSVEFSSKPSEADLRRAFDEFTALPQERHLPSAPARPVIYMTEANRPQPRKDAERERGMAAFVGRLRPCPVLDYKFIALSHNTIRGAAGAAVLNAELMHSEGMLR